MVRAAHFRVAARVIAHLAGDPAVRALSEADPALASALAPSLSPMGWLPLQLLCELVEQATVHTRKNRPADGGEMLMRAIGRSTVSATFSRFFGADPTTLGVVSVLSVLPTMWNRYHGWCRIRILKRSEGEAEAILLGDGPELAMHLVGAELEKACDLAGGRKVEVSQRASGVDHRFTLTWEPPPDD